MCVFGVGWFERVCSPVGTRPYLVLEVSTSYTTLNRPCGTRACSLAVVLTVEIRMFFSVFQEATHEQVANSWFSFGGPLVWFVPFLHHSVVLLGLSQLRHSSHLHAVNHYELSSTMSWARECVPTSRKIPT